MATIDPQGEHTTCFPKRKVLKSNVNTLIASAVGSVMTAVEGRVLVIYMGANVLENNVRLRQVRAWEHSYIGPSANDVASLQHLIIQAPCVILDEFLPFQEVLP